MCGICGFITNHDISLEQLKIMNDTMVHRGPDDGGEEIYPLNGGRIVGFAQRRLSVLDLSEQGHQPMHTEDKRISIIYNGEIYNYRELKKELSDYPYRSNCDTEVIIAAYLEWGIGCLHRLNGMFAFALWDRELEAFYLARDRIGKKPLYYQIEAGNLYFASELKALMARPGFEKTIRKEVLSRYLYQQYICHPDSIFTGVCKLEPGMVLHGRVRTADITFETHKYWDIKNVYGKMRKEPVGDFVRAKKELKELLQKAVAARLVADVPAGVFLSGGYDSSLMAAMAAESASEPIKTFSIGFHEEEFNEAKYAKEIAGYLGTDHKEAYISETEMFALIESLPHYYDEPFADSSQIPTMLVSELAAGDVTVALSGDGGDEFFCGYNIYDKVRQAQRLDGLGGILHGIYSLPGLRNWRLGEKLPFPVRMVAENRDPETKVQFGAGSYIRMAENMVLQDEQDKVLSDKVLSGKVLSNKILSDKLFSAQTMPGKMLPCNYPVESGYQVTDWQIRRMLLDMDTYLPADILCKVDRASMKYSLEARCPILDRDVMEYSFRIDHRFKYSDGVKKKILKDIAYDYIPQSMLERPKTGFRVPLDKWMRGPLKERLLDMCDRKFLTDQGIFHAGYVADMITNYIRTGDGGPSTGANYSKLAWSFFIFQQWYRQYM